MVEELSKSFQTLSKSQTSQYVAQLFNTSSDLNEFKVNNKTFFSYSIDCIKRLFNKTFPV